MQFFFPVYCVALAAWGIPRDQAAWRIVALFSLVHLVLETYVWPATAWVMPCVGAIECLTAACLLNYASNYTGKTLAFLFAFLSLWNCLFYVDYMAGYYLIYNSYNQVITLTTLAMIATGTNGLLHIHTTIRDRLGDRLSRSRSSMLSRSSLLGILDKGGKSKGASCND